MDNAASTANFAQFKLESHVRRALFTALSLSGGEPVEAAHVLRSVILASRRAKSEAFSKLASLFPLPETKGGGAGPSPSGTLEALPLAPDLAQAFSVAEGFFRQGKSIWGRDLVTLALTAPDSPSVIALASEAGVVLQDVRSEWMDYVRSSDRHRPAETWEAWWRAAGYGRTDQAPPSSAYLVLWNPDVYAFSDMDVKIKEIGDTGATAFSWRTGSRKNMAVGSRLYLFRTGGEPRGLVGVGRTTAPVAEAPHREPDRADKGETAPYVEASWVALSREPILGLEEVVSRTGEERIWSSQGGGVEIPADVAARLEAAWQEVRDPDADPRPAPAAQRLIASFDADTGNREDTLNIARYVDAFARVMSSRTLKPPLSIGLFGDWGSGKTFFMEKLHQKIDGLSRETSEESKALYWPNICQIRFNAWHYAETNLWASLVTTIFDELRAFLDGPEDDAAKSDEFNKLLNKLEVAEALREDALRRLETAEARHEIAREDLAKAEKKLAKLPPAPKLNANKYEEILSTTLAETGFGTGDDLKALVTSAADMTGREDFRKAVEDLSAEGTATVEQARDVLRQTRQMTSRAGFWWRILLAAKVQKSWSFRGVVLLIFLIPVAFLALDLGGKVQTASAVLSTTVLEVLAIGGALLTWMKTRLAEATPVFDRLDAWQSDIEQRIEEAKNRDKKIYEEACKTARVKEEAAREQVETAQQNVVRAQQAEADARQALRDSTSKARLDKFIRDRAASEDYAVHLGLIAMIHRDFRKLSDLMEKVRNDEDREETRDIPRVDRIILYIDDLDRCHPPERVVRVLEATHLLLFFPLFVVVVGVDSRWVSRALYKHYEDMLADESLHNGAAQIEGPFPSDHAPAANNGLSVRALRRPPAESHDFLEKIFQVPFWLRRMDEAAVKRMIRDLVKGDEVDHVALSAAHSVSAPATDPGGGDTSAGQPGEQEKTGAGGDRQNGDTADVQETTLTAEQQGAATIETLAPPTVGLTISAAERQFMEEVAPLMPRTPRSVKRFINIYRLYKSALSAEGLQEFLGTADDPGNFRAVQILLALVTGTPHCARRVFDQLQSTEGGAAGKLSDLVDVLEEGPENWQTTVEALRDFARDDKDLDLGALRKVSALVSRYSVHHMVAVDPGRTVLG